MIFVVISRCAATRCLRRIDQCTPHNSHCDLSEICERQDVNQASGHCMFVAGIFFHFYLTK